MAKISVLRNYCLVTILIISGVLVPAGESPQSRMTLELLLPHFHHAGPASYECATSTGDISGLRRNNLWAEAEAGFGWIQHFGCEIQSQKCRESDQIYDSKSLQRTSSCLD